MKVHYYKFSMLFFFIYSMTFAQERNISGTVTDDKGLPLPGVNILIKNTDRGTQTDFDGRYTLTVNRGTIISFSYVGFKTKDVVVGDSETINTQLSLESSILEEVIVVGFGEQTRKSLTTAISSVDVDAVRGIATPTVSGALQGAANGIQINQNSGVPGSAFSVRVRGASSINGSNEPLYVVDGVPIVSGRVGENAFGGQDNDLLNNLNFSDIESIQVLKDASSSAIYGARGANGVVLITTKRGKAGKLTVEANSYIGLQKEINRYDVFTAGEYYRFADTAFESAGNAPGTWSSANGFTASEEFYNSDFGDSYIDAIYRGSEAVIRQTDISVSGGTEKARFYLNYSDFNQEGVIFGQSFDRRSLTLNTNFKATEKLDLDGSVNITETDNSRINGDNNIYGALTTSVLEQPGFDLLNEDGSFNTDPFRFSNPLQNAIVDKSEARTFRMFSNLGLRYAFTDDFNIYTKASLERVDFKELIFQPFTTRQGAPSNGSSFKGINLINRWNIYTTLNYKKQIGDFNLTGLFGISFEGTNNDDTEVNTTSIPAGFELPVAGAVLVQADNFITEQKLFSYFGRAGASYMDMVFIEAVMRADASSVFGEDNQIGYFPSFSAAYLVSGADWFKHTIVTNLKARVSWGQTGNQSGIGNFGSRLLAGSQSYAENPGTGIIQLPAPYLTWETTTQTNLGVDITLFDRVDISYDYYIKETEDVLLSRPLRNSSGFETVAANVGSIENIGHELSINARIFDNDNFSWTLQAQFATNENEVTELQRDADGQFIPIDQGFATRIEVGQQLGAFFGLQADGLWQEGDNIPQSLVNRGISPGDVKYIDQNGDGNIDANDRAFMGNPLPKWTGNLRNTFKYKGFDLSANFQFEQDKDIYNNSLAFGGASGSFVFNKFRDQLNYWTPENTNTDIPRPRIGSVQAYNNQDSDRFIEDGSYLRLKEVVLGYTIPAQLIKNTTLRIYIGGDNLVTWTDYSGLDPEVNTFGDSNASRGTDFFTQGLNRIYKFGINLKF